MFKVFLTTLVLLASAAAAQLSPSQLTPQQKEVWSQEEKHFEYLAARDLPHYMSLWDDNFIGWPDYMDRPARKADIEASVKEEFAQEPKLAHPFPPLQPIAIQVFGDVAITHYFWPDADPKPAEKFRITHTWRKTATGWHIIGGMSCAIPADHAPQK